MKPLLDGVYFLYFVTTVCGMLALGWVWFFWVVKQNSEGVHQVLAGGAFLQNLTVIGIVVMVGVLSIGGVLTGELAATLLSGIVGYVLGTARSRSASSIPGS